jgi:hypothetical protein
VVSSHAHLSMLPVSKNHRNLNVATEEMTILHLSPIQQTVQLVPSEDYLWCVNHAEWSACSPCPHAIHQRIVLELILTWYFQFCVFRMHNPSYSACTDFIWDPNFQIICYMNYIWVFCLCTHLK